MKATNCKDERGSGAAPAGSAPGLRVVIAYDDLSAGQHAMDLLNHVGLGLGDGVPFETMPWAFELLADPGWREAAAKDGQKADIVVIASSAKTGPLPRPVAQWTEMVIRRKQGSAAAIVPLFIPGGHPDDDDSPRLASIRKLAAEAGLDCLAPARRAGQTRARPNPPRRGKRAAAPLGGPCETHPRDLRSTPIQP